MHPWSAGRKTAAPGEATLVIVNSREMGTHLGLPLPAISV